VLGRPIAQAVRALGFPVAAWTRTPRDEPGIDTFSGAAGLDPFLARTRVLVDVLPLTAASRDLIDARLLAKLRAPAFFINVARGAHVVEADLLSALASGHLAGAALDVCRDEPAGPDHPFWSHPRISFTPHVAAMTLRHESIAQIAHKVMALERGEPIDGVISHERGY
jgi:glyoxylate/hydroxypyruvate reductase A